MPFLGELIRDPAWTLAVAENREMLFFRSEQLAELPQHYRLDKRYAWSLIAEEARRMIINAPDYHMSHVTLAEALLHLGDRQQAIKAFRDYLVLEPGDIQITGRLAELESRN